MAPGTVRGVAVGHRWGRGGNGGRADAGSPARRRPGAGRGAWRDAIRGGARWGEADAGRGARRGAGRGWGGCGAALQENNKLPSAKADGS
ncbi:hypothetical protein GUJ93_ZPchr0013g34860 [Zizania palustris]|uniref:Uncharacterized protein n=1 Tax=Zizania palustris TaxID=103762 RepID=A0A8J5X621_ZIZPA|nr:hypothetical protein GUJ93_ZPchr0013g34860 [Zizania palustris]